MDIVRELFAHNAMMNSRLLAACRELAPAQLNETVVGTYGPIGATLVHIANSQGWYAAQFLASERPDRIDEDPLPDMEMLASRLAASDALLERAAGLAATDGEVEVTGDDPPGRWTMHRSLLLLQAINHGTEHRSQIATIMTQLGIEPPPMDGWTYFFDQGHMVEVD